MPAPTLNQVRDAIRALVQQHPNVGNKKLCALLNQETNFFITNKEFRQHLKAMKPDAAKPSPDDVYTTIKALRIQNPTMGVKKLVAALNAENAWHISTREVRQYLAAVDSEV